MKPIAILTDEVKYPCPDCGGCVIFTKEEEVGCNGCGYVYELEIHINLIPKGIYIPRSTDTKKECEDNNETSN